MPLGPGDLSDTHRLSNDELKQVNRGVRQIDAWLEKLSKEDFRGPRKEQSFAFKENIVHTALKEIVRVYQSKGWIVRTGTTFLHHRPVVYFRMPNG